MKPAYGMIKSPDRKDLLRELRTPVDVLAGFAAWAAGGSKLGEGTHRQVLLVPGFGASERSMALMGLKLTRLGHHVHQWGLGRNTGDVPALLEGLRRRAEAVQSEVGEPLVAVGWSLGGYLAREAAREAPAVFRKVITLGSPVVGGPKFTSAAGWYRARGWDLDAIEREVCERFSVPLQVPVTALYSRRDGVVAWQACIDHWSPRVRHVEVDCSHLAMGFSGRVVAMVCKEVAGED